MDANENTILNEDHRKLKSAGFLGKKGLLIVLSPDSFGLVRVVDKSDIVIGRHSECDLKIPDPLLSRKHCMVTVDEAGDFYLEDLNSTNSTYLNSKELKAKSKLHYGDRIVLGTTILRFYIEEEVEKK
jgi:pSer/pThr/pTyr-binding forkhead associated (FHA) protein